MPVLEVKDLHKKYGDFTADANGKVEPCHLAEVEPRPLSLATQQNGGREPSASPDPEQLAPLAQSKLYAARKTLIAITPAISGSECHQ